MTEGLPPLGKVLSLDFLKEKHGSNLEPLKWTIGMLSMTPICSKLLLIHNQMEDIEIINTNNVVW